MIPIIEQWRSDPTPGTHWLYLIIDSLHEPNPIPQWCEREWTSPMLPLYYQTPMEPILKTSPWLCQVSPLKLAEIEAWIDQQQDATWGWLYLSELPWQQQIAHWHTYLRIMIDGQLRAVRLQDPRILSIWLAEQLPALWQGLLGPITALQLPDQPILYRPHQLSAIADPLPWELPAALSDAWHHSPMGIKVTARNFELALWEHHGQLAESVYQQGGDIAQQLSSWLASQIEMGKTIRALTLDDITIWADTMAQRT